MFANNMCDTVDYMMYFYKTFMNSETLARMIPFSVMKQAFFIQPSTQCLFFYFVLQSVAQEIMGNSLDFFDTNLT